MKKLAFACLGAAALLTSACNRNNADQVNNAEMNQYGAEQLNDLANEAANNAEAEALGTQQQQLEAQNEAAAANTADSDADEQNVSGMYPRPWCISEKGCRIPGPAALFL
jgi:hypothetical protein